MQRSGLSDPPTTSDRTSAQTVARAAEPAQPEVIEQASELLRPLLKKPEQARQAAAQLVAFTETHVGPLPHPSTFGGYNDVLPGSAQEILDMAKREQGHRHRMELLENLYPYCGLCAGVLALLACVAGSIYLGMHDKTSIAVALLGAPLLAAVGWFVNSRLKRAEVARVVAASSKPQQRPRRR